LLDNIIEALPIVHDNRCPAFLLIGLLWAFRSNKLTPTPLLYLGIDVLTSEVDEISEWHHIPQYELVSTAK
jgi:hypothetical protein